MSAHAVIEAPTSCAVLPVVGSDTLVPLVDGRSVPYANLDVAASAPALQVVADRVNEVLPLYASVHRGAGYLSQVSTALYEAARQTIGAFVGAREDDVTIVTRNTTDSLNLLAGCVPAQADGTPGRVLVLDVEHHANLLPWQRTGGATVLVGGATVAETLSGLRAELSRFPYALVAITGASNVTGESLPLSEVVAAAHDAGARVLLDGAQLVPHRGVSLAASDVDYVAFSGHKTYAPFGAGALVGRRDWLDAGTPYLAGRRRGAQRDARRHHVAERPGAARGRVAQRDRRGRARLGVRRARCARARACWSRTRPSSAPASSRGSRRSTACASSAPGPTPWTPWAS